MTRSRLAALLALALPLAAACTATETTPESGGTASSAPEATMTTPEATRTPAAGETARANPADPESERDSCGTGKVRARWTNALPTADVKAAIAAAVGKRPIRYYGEGDPITMDYSEDRLNVVLGEDGRIAEFRCG